MSLHLISARPGAALLSDGWRVPAAEVPALREAADALVAANARLAEVERYREEARAAARAEGYAAGRAEGLASGREESGRGLIRLAAEAAAERETLRESVGRLALDVVRRIAHQLGPEATLQALAEQAVRDVLPEQPLTVRVPAGAVGAVEQRLWPLNTPIDVVADESLGDGDVVIETPHGRANAGLEVQLAALERAFTKAGQTAGVQESTP